jgi:hypothetical protein
MRVRGRQDARADVRALAAEVVYRPSVHLERGRAAIDRIGGDLEAFNITSAGRIANPLHFACKTISHIAVERGPNSRMMTRVNQHEDFRTYATRTFPRKTTRTFRRVACLPPNRCVDARRGAERQARSAGEARGDDQPARQHQNWALAAGGAHLHNITAGSPPTGRHGVA